MGERNKVGEIKGEKLKEIKSWLLLDGYLEKEEAQYLIDRLEEAYKAITSMKKELTAIKAPHPAAQKKNYQESTLTP